MEDQTDDSNQTERMLTIRVIDQARNAVVGATVQVLPGANQATGQPKPVESGQTDKQGYCRITLPPASYFVKVFSEGFGSSGTSMTLGDQNVSRVVTLTRLDSEDAQDDPNLDYIAQHMPEGTGKWQTLGVFKTKADANQALAKVAGKGKKRVVTKRK